MLVLSKVYLVTKGSLVPLVVAAVGARPAATSWPTANARLGLLSSLASLVASIPAIGVLELLGGSWVLRLDMVVFVVGTVVALRLPVGRARLAAWGERRRRRARRRPSPTPPRAPGTRRRPLGALGPAGQHPPRGDPGAVGHVDPAGPGGVLDLPARLLAAPQRQRPRLVRLHAGVVGGRRPGRGAARPPGAQGPDRAPDAGRLHLVGGAGRRPWRPSWAAS